MKTVMKYFALMLALVLLPVSTEAQQFSHEMPEGSRPWTNTEFDISQDRFLFAVHSDLTGGERPNVFEIALSQLELFRPEFLISVGDLIEGGEVDRKQHTKEWEEYDRRVDSFSAPVFYVGGNHDFLSVLGQQIWVERNGPRYYHFRYKRVLFLVLDTEDYTPEQMDELASLKIEAAEVYKSKGSAAVANTAYGKLPDRAAGLVGPRQSAYFQKVIAANSDVRWTFLFMHKPAWERPNEENFTAIETALRDRQYTVFNGHKHVYQHITRNGQDYIQLATTGGEQYPKKGLSEDHVTLVTVTGDETDIVNVMLGGIRDKTGGIPKNGELICFSAADCGQTK